MIQCQVTNEKKRKEKVKTKRKASRDHYRENDHYRDSKIVFASFFFEIIKYFVKSIIPIDNLQTITSIVFLNSP